VYEELVAEVDTGLADEGGTAGEVPAADRAGAVRGSEDGAILGADQRGSGADERR
jgi:hypothetical protein